MDISNVEGLSRKKQLNRFGLAKYDLQPRLFRWYQLVRANFLLSGRRPTTTTTTNSNARNKVACTSCMYLHTHIYLCMYIIIHMQCFFVWFWTRGILFCYREVCTVRGEMCGFPLTRPDHHRTDTRPPSPLRVVPRTAATTPIRHRSPGQTGHEESPAESYSQHTHTHTLCSHVAAVRHAFVYIFTHLLIHRVYVYTRIHICK